MHSGNSLSPQHPAVPAVLGFCSIVLEGRSTCDEDGGDDGDSLATSSKLLPDDTQRINQKLQLLIAGTSQEYCEKNVLCASSSSRTDDEHFEKFGNKNLSSLLPFRNRDSWSPTRSSKIMYSGFETMKPFGNVSPNKSATSPRSFINALSLTTMTSPATTNGAKKNADKARPKEGPHCQQFLKKIGLIKIDPLDETEHACNIYNKYVSNENHGI